MRYRTHPRRRGFTLIELLVVIAIIALLAALTAAAVGRVASVQQAKNTDNTVQKLQKGLNQQVTAIVDEATKTGNPYLASLIPFCDGDADRAKALLAYAYLKRELPQTFAEALYTVPIGSGIPPHKAFSTIPTGASGLSADQESAVLLYLILMEKGNRGQVMPTEEASSGATTKISGTNFIAFKDGYGNPIAFRRWYGPGLAELQSMPYVNPSSPDSVKYKSVDKFDPLGKLSMLPAMTWPISGSTNRNAALNALRALDPGGLVVGNPVVDFDGQYKYPTVISAGADDKFNTPDDVFGHRLARPGQQGN